MTWREWSLLPLIAMHDPYLTFHPCRTAPLINGFVHVLSQIKINFDLDRSLSKAGWPEMEEEEEEAVEPAIAWLRSAIKKKLTYSTTWRKSRWPAFEWGGTEGLRRNNLPLAIGGGEAWRANNALATCSTQSSPSGIRHQASGHGLYIKRCVD